jgi:hypothetical protein
MKGGGLFLGPGGEALQKSRVMRALKARRPGAAARALRAAGETP